MNDVEKQVLLSGLRSLLANKPVFDGLNQQAEGYDWVGRARAMIGMHSAEIARVMDPQIERLEKYMTFSIAWGQVVMLTARAVTELEMQLASSPYSAAKAFGPGAVYDVHKALRATLRQVQSGVLIVDPYMDGEIFDEYISALRPGIKCELLTSRHERGVAAAARKYLAQHGAGIEIRSSASAHDRLILIDAKICWVLGQSIKDAAVSKPTYLAPLDEEISQIKVMLYADIWKTATVLFPQP